MSYKIFNNDLVVIRNSKVTLTLKNPKMLACAQ